MKYQVLQNQNMPVRHNLVPGVPYSCYNNKGEFETPNINDAYKYCELIAAPFSSAAPFMVIEKE